MEAVGIASLGLGLLGTGMNVWSGLFGSQSQAAMDEYNASVSQRNAEAQYQQSNYNAKVAEQNAGVARRSAEAERTDAAERVSRQRHENQRYLSAQRAQMGASGLTNEGSPLAVLSGAAGNLEMGAMDTKREGELRAYDKELAATNYDSAGKMYKWQGDWARTAGDYQADYYNRRANASRSAGWITSGANLLSGLSQFGFQSFGLFGGGQDGVRKNKSLFDFDFGGGGSSFGGGGGSWGAGMGNSGGWGSNLTGVL
jgi:hypothetical protein